MIGIEGRENSGKLVTEKPGPDFQTVVSGGLKGLPKCPGDRFPTLWRVGPGFARGFIVIARDPWVRRRRSTPSRVLSRPGPSARPWSCEQSCRPQTASHKHNPYWCGGRWEALAHPDPYG